MNVDVIRLNPLNTRMKRLLRGDPEYVIRWYRLILAAALVVGLIVVQLDWPGVIACVFAAALGAAGGSFGAYRSERGLLDACRFVSVDLRRDIRHYCVRSCP